MTTQMPRWDVTDGGSMIRGALWLLQVVGEGNTFTKNQLREAFPGVSQIDRRIRDLRDFGWVVYSNTEDARLTTEDQRFVRAGVPVWDSKARRDAAPQKAISTKDRQAVLARDSYMCTLCGIAGGETYPDDAVLTAVLGVSRRLVRHPDGTEELALVTECKRCRSGRGSEPISVADAVEAIRALDVHDQKRITRWMERGRRGTTDLDRAWSAFLAVPPEQRKSVLDAISAARDIR
ncbi:hypothetical protein [Demequina iriomotensis]|uniref:hypothetical protein n=1 Tax=Demequina iriomotensis TaxID=1536641 RepID=UPI001E2AF7F8|nr:hypothetical protein [Demequina iriomotensis]